ncbi:MAG: PH domain-containing protein [Armatimonadetes bacterium]|nr:PH domain-containing protein [Armatimonadota bacterium]
MKTTYRPAKMDTAHTIVTVFVFLVLGFFLVLAVSMHEKPMWGASALVAVVIAISWQMRPARYEVSDEAVRIVRAWPFKSIAIPKAEIKDVRPVTLTWKTIRTCGVGGLFGSGGWFWNKELGRFFVAMTNGHSLVLIANGGKYVISPENPERFVQDLKSSLGLS